MDVGAWMKTLGIGLRFDVMSGLISSIESVDATFVSNTGAVLAY